MQSSHNSLTPIWFSMTTQIMAGYEWLTWVEVLSKDYGTSLQVYLQGLLKNHYVSYSSKARVSYCVCAPVLVVVSGQHVCLKQGLKVPCIVSLSLL